MGKAKSAARGGTGQVTAALLDHLHGHGFALADLSPAAWLREVESPAARSQNPLARCPKMSGVVRRPEWRAGHGWRRNPIRRTCITSSLQELPLLMANRDDAQVTEARCRSELQQRA